MFIADAHCDTLYRIAIAGIAPEACDVTLARMKAGGVSLQTFALFAGENGPQGTPYSDGLNMLAAAPKTGVPMLTGDLPDALPSEPHGIFSCEGGEMFCGSIARFDEFMQSARLRMVALTWNHENEIGYPAVGGEKRGLKPFGFELLRAMDAAGAIADCSHLNEAGFWDLIDRAELPPMASHSCCKHLCDVPRNLTREQIKALIERGGFIGVNFYPVFLHPDGRATLEDAVRHIDEICQMGGEHIVGLGSDFDGIESWPEGLRSPADFPALMDALRRRGYGEDAINDIAGGNLWRALKHAEAHARRH